MKRLASLTREIADVMQVSFDGYPYEKAAHSVETGEFALLSGETQDGIAYAIVSRSGDCACIEVLEGPGGTALCAAIVTQAAKHGLDTEAWVFSKSRTRLTKRAGMCETGNTRLSYSGRIQYHVSTK